MKITIVSPCDLPVPAIKGGAVATLIESIIKQNEINKKVDLTIISSFDEIALQKSLEYENTKFIFIKEPKICKLIDDVYESIYKMLTRKEHKILKKYAWKIYVIMFLKKYFLENTTDRIILENSGYLLNILQSKKISTKYNNRIYYHLHNDIPNNIKTEYLKKCNLLLISRYLENKIKKFIGMEIDKKVFILKNGFDCDMFTQKISSIEKQQLKDKLKIPKDKKIIIYVGRITEEKGIKELTEAFQKLNDERLILLVVGSHNFGGKNTTLFEKNMKKKFLTLEEKVKFTGFVPYQEVWKYYKIADLAVLPSIWQEPAGLTMLEATAANLPLITTKTGGIPEYLNDKQVIMLDVNNKIINSIEENIKNYFNFEEKYKEIAKKSSKFVIKNYNEEKFYNDFIRYISE